MNIKTALVGEWSLDKFEIENKSNGTRKWRENSHGILIYTDSGYMSVSINSDIRDNEPSSADKYDSFLFYAGLYEIIEEIKVIHHVKNASDTTRIGKSLTRNIILNGDTLKLIGKGEFGVATLHWNRIVNK